MTFYTQVNANVSERRQMDTVMVRSDAPCCRGAAVLMQIAGQMDIEMVPPEFWLLFLFSKSPHCFLVKGSDQIPHHGKDEHLYPANYDKCGQHRQQNMCGPGHPLYHNICTDDQTDKDSHTSHHAEIK